MKTYRKKITQCIVIVAMTLGLATAAHAQLGGLVKKKSDKSGATTPATMSAEDFGKALDVATSDVSAARILFLDSQISLGKALGLKEESLLQLAESKAAITSAKTPAEKNKAITDSINVSKDAMDQSSALMAESDTLNDEAKKHFVDGAAKCIDGVAAEAAQVKVLADLVNSGKDIIKNASPMQKKNVIALVQPTTSLAAVIPQDVKAGATSVSQIIEFANKKGIEIPNAGKAKEILGSL